MSFTLTCASLDNHPLSLRKVFSIRVRGDGKTSQIEEKLRQRMEGLRESGPPPSLSIWKVAEGLYLDGRLASNLRAATFSEEEALADEGLIQLFGATQLQVVYRDNSRPPERARSPLEESFFKHTRVVSTPPSQLALPTTYWSLRDTDERILDGRTEADTDIPPILLMYPGFGLFLDITKGHTDVDGLSNVKTSGLRDCVDLFAAATSYGPGGKKTGVGLSLLDQVFALQDEAGPFPMFRLSRGSDHVAIARQCGDANCSHGEGSICGAVTVIVVFEESDDLGPESRLPEVETVGPV